ncbi:hypothetical protein [Flavobacterium sp.]|uniref:hypothetical protein n=1 Tax=Flavobacterium sp. TaxID=239 RepID=UPI002486D299|nr:hypothetical protein [Flavobacterium sp.]MDI1316211.1 hypothetical protein [Flavobacterium sp.]
MINSQTFKLIDGDFSAEESLEIIRNVFSSKIQFHQMKNFSSQERFGYDDKTAMIRIPQLKKSLDEIIKLIESTEMKGPQFEIKSDVVIRFTRPSEHV